MSAEVPTSQWVPRMRSRAEVEYMLQDLSSRTYHGAAFLRGGRDTLLWVLGRVETAPVTGRVVPRPISYTAVGQEANEATTAMYNGGRPPTPDGRRLQDVQLSTPYLQGVEHLAMWVTGSDTLGRAEDWPFPAEAPPATHLEG